MKNFFRSTVETKCNEAKIKKAKSYKDYFFMETKPPVIYKYLIIIVNVLKFNLLILAL